MSRDDSGRRLLVFARNPLPGRVKTRLIPGLGADAACALYRRLLSDTLGVATRVGAVDTEIWLDDGPAIPWLLRRAAALGTPIRRQSGADLGARMRAALTTSLEQARAAVLIGSDCPEYDPGYLEAAFAALDRYDAVIGPAADGGYVLIGLRRPPPGRLFEDISWGGPGVYAATCDRLDRLGMRWQALPLRRDLDDPAGLVDFPHLAALVSHPGGPGTGADNPGKG